MFGYFFVGERSGRERERGEREREREREEGGREELGREIYQSLLSWTMYKLPGGVIFLFYPFLDSVYLFMNLSKSHYLSLSYVPSLSICSFSCHVPFLVIFLCCEYEVKRHPNWY